MAAMRARTSPPAKIALFLLGSILVPASGTTSFDASSRGPGPSRPGFGPRPIRVLILSGENNHDWTSTTPKLEALLKRSGRFLVEITETPALLTDRSLEPYDVVLSNWNVFGREPAVTGWTDETRRAYLDFIRRGKGHVVVHAGSSSFPDWEEYGRLTLAVWKNGMTTHGPLHEFTVRIEDASHPVTAGMEPFRIFDELWNKPGVSDGAAVLASSYSAPDREGTGHWEPAVLAGRFGAGRSVTILLGHDTESMDNPGFQTLLRRGVEWAATGRIEAPAGPATNRWRWEKQDGASLALVGPRGPVWRFRYDRAIDVPYFHPLNTVAGRTMTADRPPDHIWHHGLWFSWKFINKVNYWEVDPKTGQPAGRTSWANDRVAARDDHSALIAMDLAYGPVGEDAPVLTEKRTINVSAPDPEGVYAIDWTGVFTAKRAVVLDRTPLPGEPDGQVWGGYAGLSLRLAGDLDGRQVMTDEGPVGEMTDDRYRGRHAAVDYSGLLDGQPSGAAIFDLPGNPRSPTPWYVIKSAEMSFFTPAVLCYEPMTLQPGERVTLRYRVLVHPGRWDAARLRREYERWIHESRDPR
jgi:type 1 glutamine amidotransferase